jgi:Amidohydrolase family
MQTGVRKGASGSTHRVPGRLSLRPEPLCDNPQQTCFTMRSLRIALGWMVGLSGVAGLAGLALPGVPAWPQPQIPVLPKASASVPLVLAGGTVVDVTDWGRSARDQQDSIVIVRDGRITDVGARGAVTIPKGARVIDCTGKFLIPGMIDGFAGMNSQGQANANLYMGVTSVVVRGDEQRGPIDFSANPTPHLYLIDSIGTTDNWSLLARRPDWAAKLYEGLSSAELSPEDTARQLADTAKMGTRVLWLGHDLTAANTQWIVARAHQMGLITYGEFVSTPYSVGIDDGVDVLLHMGRYELGVIPAELQGPLVDSPSGPAASTAYDYSERLPPTDGHLISYAKLIAAHHAALMPTFSLSYLQLPDHRNLWKEPAAELLDSSHMYLPSDRATGETVYPLPAWAHRMPAVAQRYLLEGQHKKADQAVMRFWRINQTIFASYPHYLAASGASSMGTMAGISMHTELEMLVRLGLSAREALAAATNNYSLQFGWNELGQISPGRRADILVLDADPTVNIWNVRRISGLVVDGNVLDRDGLLNLKK